MLYHQFRILLVVPGLFEREVSAIARESRADFLRRVFTDQFEFTHRQSVVFFKPMLRGERYVGGMFGRQRRKHVNAPPDRSFAPEDQNYWVAVNAFVDTDTGEHGQRFLIAHKSEFATTQAIAKSVQEYLQSKTSEYTVFVNAMFQPDDFWAVVRAFPGPITEAMFEFAAPNVFGSSDVTGRLLKRFRDEAGAETATVSLNNDDEGLQRESAPLQEGVDYCSKGGGKAVFKSKKKIVARTDTAPILTIEDEHELEISGLNPEQMSTLVNRLMK